MNEKAIADLKASLALLEKQESDAVKNLKEIAKDLQHWEYGHKKGIEERAAKAALEEKALREAQEHIAKIKQVLSDKETTLFAIPAPIAPERKVDKVLKGWYTIDEETGTFIAENLEAIKEKIHMEKRIAGKWKDTMNWAEFFRRLTLYALYNLESLEYITPQDISNKFGLK